MITADAQYRLLLLAPSAESASVSTTSKYRFISSCSYDYLATQRVHVSDLKEAIVEVVKEAEGYQDRPNSDFHVKIYECLELLVPAAPTIVSMCEAFEVVNEEWLKRHCNFIPPRRLPANVRDNCVLAVLTVQTSSRSAVPLSIAHEVNESLGQIHREQIAAAAHQRQSPSSGATVSQLLQTQTTSRIDAVYNCRPLELTGPPITMYHPVFANFLKYMQEARDFTHDELYTAQNFVTQAVAYHRDEATRHDNLNIGSFTFDGAVSTTMKTHDNFKPLILAHELKLEIGEGGCDPSLQAQNVYVAYYSSDEARPIRELSCCPAIIIGSAGPNIQVSGAVFADQLVVQNLGDSISVVPRPNLGPRSMLDDAGYRVAQLFYALRQCLKELDNYYTNLIRLMAVRGRRAGEVGVMPGRPARPSYTGVTRTLQPALLIGPHFQRYVDEQGKTVTLTYKRRLATEYPMKAVFVAEAKTDTETRDVVVKFTPVYGKAAHELLASASPPQAPKLHFCDVVESVGMWVVVMDYVEGKTVAGVLHDSARVASLQNAVKTLHANGFVFGDLRNPNVLEVGDGVMLIDFDWCGKEGTARYPSDILLEEGVWHAGVQRGGLL